MGVAKTDLGGRFCRSREAELLRHNIFDKPSPAADWLAGLIAADGCIASDRKHWRLSQSGAEGRALMDHVRTLINHRLSLCAQPTAGRTAYSVYVPSADMVGALGELYGIGPRKTLTLGGPPLQGIRAANFLRGYLDGDGCVQEYKTKTCSYLHISAVGTPAFIEWAAAVTPIPGGRVRRLLRCRNLSEIRYSGKTACGFGIWLYSDLELYQSPKMLRYLDHVTRSATRWQRNLERKRDVAAYLTAGKSLRQTARLAGVLVQTVCAWKKEMAQ